MFHRILVHLDTIDPLTIHSVSLRTDSDGNFDGVTAFGVIEHSQLPADSRSGDLCLAEVNMGSFHTFHHTDRIILRGIERLYRENETPSWEDVVR